MANIFDVARYIIEKKGANGRMSTMKLQKLCYYAQAWSLVWETPLFEEDFEAWANGPVCRPLYEKTKGQYSTSPEDETGGQGDLTEEQIENIDMVLDFYGDKDAQWLSRLTHMEDPWKNARANVPIGAPCNNIITKESMEMYYGGL